MDLKPTCFYLFPCFLIIHHDKTVFIKEQVKEVESNADFDDDDEVVKRRFYTFNNNSSDTLILCIDYEVKYVQIVLPTKNLKGEKIGYTSYKKYMRDEDLAMN